ncbi:helix-turn-helix domain-containing protein [Microvirga pudoricolor]|uniref:helix-turn-helix domain-containing protein n=1 Tax=Microvirga pudoricolor TaxID=2778729 RepID=UPI00194E1E36|nr:XRE family transcriptional regulator [Microvirga pudoricolor]MBM6594343.1 helix-turn-helix transcriptional regulator [Microvirga pudoricolor]
MENSQDINARIAGRLRGLRLEQGLTLEGLADRTGVSRSMLSLIERGESSPTAAILDRLASGLGIALASLFADEKRPDASPLARHADQTVWQDPGSGYLRRALSAPGYPSPIELAEVRLPADARVAYEAAAHPRGLGQQIWLIEGRLDLTGDGRTFSLEAGDCLSMHLDAPTIFHNPGPREARYLVAIARDPRHASPSHSS